MQSTLTPCSETAGTCTGKSVRHSTSRSHVCTSVPHSALSMCVCVCVCVRRVRSTVQRFFIHCLCNAYWGAEDYTCYGIISHDDPMESSRNEGYAENASKPHACMLTALQCLPAFTWSGRDTNLVGGPCMCVSLHVCCVQGRVAISIHLRTAACVERAQWETRTACHSNGLQVG